MAAGFRSPLPHVGQSAPSTHANGFKSLLAFWSGGAGITPVSSGPGFKSLLAFWAGGSASSGGGVAPVAPGFQAGYPPPKRRKRPIWIGDQLAELVDGHSPEFIEEAAELVAEEAEAPRFEEIRAVAKAHKQEAKVLKLYKEQDYSQMLALYARLREEDDIETLLMLL